MEQKISHELISILAGMAGMGVYVSEFVRGDPAHGEVDHIKIFFPDDDSLTSPYGSIEPGVEEDLSRPYGYDGRASASLSDEGLRPFVTELRSHSNELVYLASKRDHG